MVSNGVFNNSIQDWQETRSDLVTRLSRQAEIMLQKISRILNPASYWLEVASRYQFQPETVASNMDWLYELISGLVFSSNWLNLALKQGLLSSFPVPSFIWFDPKYWTYHMSEGSDLEFINEIDTNDETPVELVQHNSSQGLIRSNTGLLPTYLTTRRESAKAFMPANPLYIGAGSRIMPDHPAQVNKKFYPAVEVEPITENGVVPTVPRNYIPSSTPILGGPHSDRLAFRMAENMANKSLIHPELHSEYITRFKGDGQPAIYKTIYKGNTGFTLNTPGVISLIADILAMANRSSGLSQTIPSAGTDVRLPATILQRQNMRLMSAENPVNEIFEQIPPQVTERSILNTASPMELPPRATIDSKDAGIYGKSNQEISHRMTFPGPILRTLLPHVTANKDDWQGETIGHYEEPDRVNIFSDYSPSVRRISAPVIDTVITPIAQKGKTNIVTGERSQGISGGFTGAVTLALASTNRSQHTGGSSESSTSSQENRRTTPGQGESNTAAYDPELLAIEVYAILKKRLLIERERAQGIA